EQAIAQWKGTEDAIIFSSGYMANLGTITAVVGTKDLILGDAYNHSSLKNGAKLSGAKVLEYNHNQTADLRSLLVQHRSQHRRCLVVTDSVFSMDGDLCPLPEILNLAAEFNSMVLVDEAHGTGVLGPTGAGCVEHFGFSGQPLIQMGTLSKALGSLGGYVAGTATLIDYLRNRAASWIYTTGLSPSDTAAAIAAIRIIQSEPELRQQLWQRIAHLKSGLSHLSGYSLLPSESPIVCVELNNAEQALKLGQQLLDQGIYAPAIRPPTVPTSRIRLSVMATHTQAQIEQLINTLSQIGTLDALV
ncbi:MAG TPA: 8-amino-7-oxononanoate synthase, partial [Stenomitos sp.]